MFSMAVLAAMVSIALDMVVRVAATFWTTALVQEFILKESMSDGMTSQAMQQGGMGLILTALILTTPPMAAMFFQGTLGTFMAYSQIGGGASASPSADGRPPGMSAPPPAAPEAASGHNAANPQNSLGRVFDGTGGSTGATPGQRGAANSNQGN
jgi:type IV secretion system protein VirB6